MKSGQLGTEKEGLGPGPGVVLRARPLLTGSGGSEEKILLSSIGESFLEMRGALSQTRDSDVPRTHSETCFSPGLNKFSFGLQVLCPEGHL